VRSFVHASRKLLARYLDVLLQRAHLENVESYPCFKFGQKPVRNTHAIVRKAEFTETGSQPSRMRNNYSFLLSLALTFRIYWGWMFPNLVRIW